MHQERQLVADKCGQTEARFSQVPPASHIASQPLLSTLLVFSLVLQLPLTWVYENRWWFYQDRLGTQNKHQVVAVGFCVLLYAFVCVCVQVIRQYENSALLHKWIHRRVKVHSARTLTRGRRCC
jgi:hypothetical protein